jgi:predicted  nucleic acid-binding Zn-ribbon protein
MKTPSAGFALTRAWWCFFLVFPVLFFGADADIAALRANAEKGNVVAQYNLGLAYAAGEVVPKDAIEAYVWLRLATENGATGKALGLLMGEMSPSELVAGKLRIDERRRAISTLASDDRGAPSASPAIVPPPPASAAPVTPSPTKEAAGPAVDSSAALAKGLAALRDDKVKLRQEIDLARKELDSAKAAATEDRGKLEAAMSGQTQKLAALSAELDAARKELASAQKASADATASLQKLIDEQNGINRQLAEAQTSIEGLKRENADLQAERTSFTARLAQPAPAASAAAGAVDDVARLKSDLARAEQTLEMTVRSFARMRQENERLKAQLEQAEAQHPAAGAKVTTP